MHKKQQKFQKNKQEERISKFNAKHKKKAFYHWGGNGFARRQLQALQVPLGNIWIPYRLPLRN